MHGSGQPHACVLVCKDVGIECFYAYHRCMCRVGQNHIYTVSLAGKSSNVRSYAVHIYGSGQPYACGLCLYTSTAVPPKHSYQIFNTQLLGSESLPFAMLVRLPAYIAGAANKLPNPPRMHTVTPIMYTHCFTPNACTLLYPRRMHTALPPTNAHCFTPSACMHIVTAGKSGGAKMLHSLYEKQGHTKTVLRKLVDQLPQMNR